MKNFNTSHKQFKNKNIIKSFLINHGSKFCSLTVNGSRISCLKRDIMFGDKLINIKGKVYDYNQIRKISQKDKTIYL